MDYIIRRSPQERPRNDATERGDIRRSPINGRPKNSYFANPMYIRAEYELEWLVWDLFNPDPKRRHAAEAVEHLAGRVGR